VVIALVAGLVLAILVAGGLLAVRGGAEDTTAIAPSPSSGSPSGGFTSSPSAPVDPAGFVDRLPADLADCTEAPLAGDGDVAAAACGAAQSQPGPTEAEFFLYPGLGTLDAVFENDVVEEGLTEFAGDDDCATATGFAEWTYSTGVTGGQVACRLTPDGQVLVAWTDERYLAEGVVRAPGTTQADVSALFDWWTAHSEFVD
jgi:hypothetical protein